MHVIKKGPYSSNLLSPACVKSGFSYTFVFFRARSSVHTEPDEASMSISMLNRHIHSLRKRIRRFEEHFEQERNYKVQGGM